VFFGGTKHDNPLYSPEVYFGPLTSILAGITGKETLLTNIKNAVTELLKSAKELTDQAIAGGTTATVTDVLNIPLGNLAIMINSLKSKKVLAGGREYDNPLSNPKFYFDPLASILTGITGKETLLTNIKNAVKELLKSAQELTELPLRATGIAPDILNIPLGNLAVIINSLKNEHITAGGREYDNPLRKPEIYFGPLASILTGITGKGAILTNIKDELTQLLNSAKTVAEQPIVTTSPNLSTSLVNMTSVLKTIDNYFAPSNDLGSVAHLLENIHNNTKGRISHDLGAVVRRYNALSRDLARINEVNIDASLTRLNTGLGRNRVVQIENAAANITINLDVKLRTEDIERALYERSQTGKAPGRPGTITQDSWNKLSTDTAGH
jgi:phenylpyruvate tautomerase PptA (4-oxalocrotonate tautomerase family)